MTAAMVDGNNTVRYIPWHFNIEEAQKLSDSSLDERIRYISQILANNPSGHKLSAPIFESELKLWTHWKIERKGELSPLFAFLTGKSMDPNTCELAAKMLSSSSPQVVKDLVARGIDINSRGYDDRTIIENALQAFFSRRLIPWENFQREICERNCHGVKRVSDHGWETDKKIEFILWLIGKGAVITEYARRAFNDAKYLYTHDYLGNPKETQLQDNERALIRELDLPQQSLLPLIPALCVHPYQDLFFAICPVLGIWEIIFGYHATRFEISNSLYINYNLLKLKEAEMAAFNYVKSIHPCTSVSISDYERKILKDVKNEIDEKSAEWRTVFPDSQSENATSLAMRTMNLHQKLTYLANIKPKGNFCASKAFLRGLYKPKLLLLLTHFIRCPDDQLELLTCVKKDPFEFPIGYDSAGVEGFGCVPTLPETPKPLHTYAINKLELFTPSFPVTEAQFQIFLYFKTLYEETGHGQSFVNKIMRIRLLTKRLLYRIKKAQHPNSQTQHIFKERAWCAFNIDVTKFIDSMNSMKAIFQIIFPAAPMEMSSEIAQKTWVTKHHREPNAVVEVISDDESTATASAGTKPNEAKGSPAKRIKK